MIAHSRRNWSIAVALAITLLLSVQLLQYSRSPDRTLIPSEWQDWVASRWKGGTGSEAKPSPPAQNVESLTSTTAVPSAPAQDANALKSKTQEPSVLPTSAEASTSTRAEPSVAAQSSEAPKSTEQVPSTSAPSAEPSKERASPTAAYEILETQKPIPKGFDPNSQMFDLNDPVHDPAGPRPDQIVLLTGTDGLGHNAEVKDIVNMALHNRREYCARHGYINHFVNMSRIEIPEHPHPVWKKLPAIVEAFQTYPDAQWVWWLDLDAIIMTEEFELETQVLSDAALEKILLRNEEYKKNQYNGFGIFTSKQPDVRKIDLLVAQDHSTVNAGSFMMRRSEATQKILSAWRDPLLMSHGFPAQEQDALIHIITTNSVLRDHVGVVGARVFNPFWHLWKKGDLLIHFAGCWVQKHCQKNWSTVWKQRYGTLEFPPPKNGTSDVDAPAEEEKET